jgi:hypothetical protein
VAAACGGEQASAPMLAGPLAERLAAQSDAIAASVDLGDGCKALRQLRELERASERAIAAQRIDAALHGELRENLRALRARIDCEPASTPLPAPPPATAIEDAVEADEVDDEADEDEDDGGKGTEKDKETGKGNGQGKGKGHGGEGKD